MADADTSGNKHAKHGGPTDTKFSSSTTSGAVNDAGEKERAKWAKLGLQGSAMAALEEKLQEVAVSVAVLLAATWWCSVHVVGATSNMRTILSLALALNK